MIDSVDKQIIQLTQSGLPLTERPYHAIAEQLHLTSGEVMVRFERMLAQGIIRRIGIIPNHYKLGYRFNGMTVWHVPEEKIDELGTQIGALDFVTHCYRRPAHPPEWLYTLFAMVHGRSQEEVENKVKHIADLLGKNDFGHEILYSSRILKKTGFRL
jgi:DNA-binding Lrp family transcriptional regulator